LFYWEDLYIYWEHFVCEGEGPNHIGAMWAEKAVARQLKKGGTDEIEVALTTRSGTAYSADEMEAIQTARSLAQGRMEDLSLSQPRRAERGTPVSCASRRYVRITPRTK
jgi:hypothetical protein